MDSALGVANVRPLFLVQPETVKPDRSDSSTLHPTATELPPNPSQEPPVLLSFHPDASTQRWVGLSSPDPITGPAGAALNIWLCCDHLTFIQRRRASVGPSEDTRTASRRPRWPPPPPERSGLAFCDYHSPDKGQRRRGVVIA